MKKNEITTLTLRVVENAIAIANHEQSGKTAKADNRVMSDKLVNYFMGLDNGHEMLTLHLTDSFKVMLDENVFGIKGVKTASGADLVTLKMNGAARFFHRSYDALNLEYTLSGYAPFKFKERVPEVVLSDEEKLVELAESIGMDIEGIDLCKAALAASNRRADNRRIALQTEMAKTIVSEKANLELAKQNSLIDTMLTMGITAEEMAEMVKARQAK